MIAALFGIIKKLPLGGQQGGGSAGAAQEERVAVRLVAEGERVRLELRVQGAAAAAQAAAEAAEEQSLAEDLIRVQLQVREAAWTKAWPPCRARASAAVPVLLLNGAQTCAGELHARQGCAPHPAAHQRRGQRQPDA